MRKSLTIGTIQMWILEHRSPFQDELGSYWWITTEDMYEEQVKDNLSSKWVKRFKYGEYFSKHRWSSLLYAFVNNVRVGVTTLS